MAIADRIVTYSASVNQTNFNSFDRNLRLSLESGGTAFIAFPAVRPPQFLVFNGSSTTLFMTVDQYPDVYHLLQTEDPVFFTAIDLFGLVVGAVHTELDLSLGEETGEGYDDQSLEAIVVRARKLEEPPAI
jgi:hypothetical protein